MFLNFFSQNLAEIFLLIMPKKAFGRCYTFGDVGLKIYIFSLDFRKKSSAFTRIRSIPKALKIILSALASDRKLEVFFTPCA